MATFQAKIGWKWMRKRENKNCHYISFLPEALLKIARKQQKNSKKTKIYHYAFISSENRLENAKKERIIKLSFRFIPIRLEIENSKKIAKKFKNFKNAIMASFQVKTGWKRPRRRKNKYSRTIPFLPEAKQKIQKKQKKIQRSKKYYYGFISSQNRLENADKQRI